MSQKEWKRNIAYEVMIACGLLALLAFVCRLWPILLLAIVAIFVMGIVLLCLSIQKVDVIKPLSMQQTQTKEPVERDLYEVAYQVLVKRINELVEEEYPEARWAWRTPNVKQMMKNNDDLYIVLNQAGGYRKARIIMRNLQAIRIDYEGAGQKETVNLSSDDMEKKEEENINESVNPMAVQWANAHSTDLNKRCKELLEEGRKELVLIFEELPSPVYWQMICHELKNKGFETVHRIPDGIKIELVSEKTQKGN